MNSTFLNVAVRKCPVNRRLQVTVVLVPISIVVELVTEVCFDSCYTSRSSRLRVKPRGNNFEIWGSREVAETRIGGDAGVQQQMKSAPSGSDVTELIISRYTISRYTAGLVRFPFIRKKLRTPGRRRCVSGFCSLRYEPLKRQLAARVICGCPVFWGVRRCKLGKRSLIVHTESVPTACESPPSAESQSQFRL